ncbi:hypothetical protein J6S88_04230 [bacterium]|nr:hypothetical protein [bacterium]
MGMAASQARYLALTARKTNVEYEGQQINQERTALANQSADAFNQYLALEVPTAPSTQDYTKVQYTYNDGFVTEAIEDMTPISGSSDYNYLVTHYRYVDVYTGIRNTKANPQVRLNPPYSPPYTPPYTPAYVGNSELTLYTAGADETLDLALEQIKKDNPDDVIASTTGNIYYYTSYGKTYFATEQELLASGESGKDPAHPTEQQINLNTYYAAYLEQKISATENAFVEFDNEGRVESISYENSSATFMVDTETITDDAAYNDAMNQYNYKKAQYEKSIQDINAKTEIIQQEDRTLELRLRQLDTEQKALTTEMEAVAAVIKKNVESTFKTFSN